MEMRRKQPLVQKIENMTPNLVQCLSGADFKPIKEKFPRPDFDEELGIYRWDDNNAFYTSIYPKSKKLY